MKNKTQSAKTNSGYTIYEPKAQATVGQLVALHFLTGKNTRNLKISRLDASNLIGDLKAAKEASKKTVSKADKTAKTSGKQISIADLRKAGLDLLKKK